MGIVPLFSGFYFIILGNYFPRIQKSHLSKEVEKEPKNVYLTALKMKLFGLSFLSKIYMLAIASKY